MMIKLGKVSATASGGAKVGPFDEVPGLEGFLI